MHYILGATSEVLFCLFNKIIIYFSISEVLFCLFSEEKERKSYLKLLHGQTYASITVAPKDNIRFEFNPQRELENCRDLQTFSNASCHVELVASTTRVPQVRGYTECLRCVAKHWQTQSDYLGSRYVMGSWVVPCAYASESIF